MLKQFNDYFYDEEFEYELFYERERGAGFGFPCSSEGEIFIKDLRPEGLKSLELCRASSWPTRIVKYKIRKVNDGMCECGATVSLPNFTNECSCGRLYNSWGQELAPREQWGEETGESWQECW